MIFQQTWEKVLSGEKTQTRRPVKPEHMACFASVPRKLVAPEDIHSSFRLTGVYAGGRAVYLVGKDYAVQKERGGKEIARIKITDLRYERGLYRLSLADLNAEGFGNITEFSEVWIKMHGPNALSLPVWAITFKIVSVA